jgi:DNA-binding protein H-NS
MLGNEPGTGGATLKSIRKPNMSKSYLTILKQIESLKAEAEKIRKQEVDGVIKRIRDAVEHYGLSAEDLGLGAKFASKGKTPFPTKKRKAKVGAKPASAGAVRVVKFRNEAGDTWGGRGKRPQWLRDALAGGKQLQDFLVK